MSVLKFNASTLKVIAICVYLILLIFIINCNKNQSIQVVNQAISAAFPSVLPPPPSPIASSRKHCSSELFTFGRVNIKLHGKQVTREHITCRRSTKPERLFGAPAVSLSLLHSHWPFCVVHTERWLSLRSRLRGSQPPLQRGRCTVMQGVFGLFG